MAELRIEKRLIDYVGLNVKGVLESWLAYPKDIGLMLALLQGMGPDGAKLVNVDANGNLQVTTAGQATPGGVTILDPGAGPGARALNQVDGSGGGISLLTYAYGYLWNGGLFDRTRSASAANLAAFSGLGAALATPPGEWSSTSQPGNGVQATATRAAGGAGVRHVCRSIMFSGTAGVAPAATALAVNLRDGTTGVGGLLASWLVFITAAIGQSVPPFGLSGLSIVGTANTAMTLEFSALLANLGQSVTVTGFDAS